MKKKRERKEKEGGIVNDSREKLGGKTTEETTHKPFLETLSPKASM